MATGTWGGLTDNHIFKVAIKFRLGVQECQTGFKLRDLAVQDNSAQDVANAVDPWLTNSFRPLLANTDTIEAIDVVRLGSEEGYSKLYTSVFGTAVLGSGAYLPTFVGANIALKTQRRKRYGQGRMFWPVRGEASVDGDIMSSGAITAFQAAIDALTSAFSGSVLTHDLVLVNAHGVIAPRAAHGSTPARPEIPPSWYDVDVVKLNTTITALRSRKIGIGS